MCSFWINVAFLGKKAIFGSTCYFWLNVQFWVNWPFFIKCAIIGKPENCFFLLLILDTGKNLKRPADVQFLTYRKSETSFAHIHFSKELESGWAF
jgi:hypothetical protein